ncbi:MAG: YciI family protein [Xanthomonadales bacterium]|nr:YciI family protein [Xanthomonadales bacterium]
MLWMILGEDRPGAAELRAQTRPAHLNHIAPLKEAGRVRFAGPLLGEGESDGQACGSLIVAEFADRAGAQAWADADPYRQAGVFASVRITPLRQVVP